MWWAIDNQSHDGQVVLRHRILLFAPVDAGSHPAQPTNHQNAFPQRAVIARTVSERQNRSARSAAIGLLRSIASSNMCRELSFARRVQKCSRTGASMKP
jgi:hypothetical protein